MFKRKAKERTIRPQRNSIHPRVLNTGPMAPMALILLIQSQGSTSATCRWEIVLPRRRPKSRDGFSRPRTESITDSSMLLIWNQSKPYAWEFVKIWVLVTGRVPIFSSQEPGQLHHNDPMSDTMLAVSRRNKSDAFGSLKLFVQANPSHPSTSYGLGVSIPNANDRPTSSPTTSTHPHIPRKPLEPEALERISPQTTVKPGSPVLGSAQSTFTPSVTKTMPDSSESATLLNTEQSDLFERHENHLRDVERKQRENRISQVPPSSPQHMFTYGETGYRREGVINFNTPRTSPYEEKKQQQEGLVPRRNPPTAPNESTTLTKVNSLRKGPGERERPVRGQPGLGAALANFGRMTSSIGTPAPSVPIPSTPSSINRDSTSSDSDRPHTLDSAASASASASSRTTLESLKSGSKFSAEQYSERSPSPHSASKTSLPSRKSFGPEFEFEENEVSFARTPHTTQDSDDSDADSDDGLFAVRPSRAEPEKLEPEKKPTLTVSTDNNKRRTVRIQSPNSASKRSFYTPSAHSSGGEASDNPDQFSGGSHETASPSNEITRRNSFASDLWASRPPVEGVIDNLDRFFPDVDLDAPYLEEPPSPNNKMNGENEATLRGKSQIPQVPSTPQAGPDPTASDGTDAATVRPPQGAVATRNISRSGGGLSRTKSIRQVAQGAAHRTKSIGPATGPRKSGDLLRRKSTKMFGHKIMQISPKPGTRLSQLDPIPQHTSQPGPVETAPQRQQTFRIIRGQLIGKGTYGRVYLGINADNGEVLAVKQVEINARIAGTDTDKIKEMVAALDQEIDTMQHLEHPNIVQYLGCERGDLSISIYLEYISGGSIGSCLRKHGKFEESVVKSLTRQTLRRSGLSPRHGYSPS